MSSGLGGCLVRNVKSWWWWWWWWEEGRKEGRKKKKKKGKKGKEGGENLFVHSTCTIMYVATQQQQQCLCCVTTALRSQHSRVLDQWVTNHVLTTRWPRAHRGSTWTLTRACHGPTRNALRVHRQWLNGLFFFFHFLFFKYLSSAHIQPQLRWTPFLFMGCCCCCRMVIGLIA